MKTVFHYSPNERMFLANLNTLHNTPNKQYDHYGNSISFFLEPIPKNVGSIFEGKNTKWVPGTTLYEHEVKVSDLPTGAHYRFVEAPEIVEIMYDKRYEDLEKGTPKHEKLLKEIAVVEKRLKLNGFLMSRDFMNNLKRYSKNIEEHYKNSARLAKIPGEEHIFNMYAANVVHLMLYVGSQILPVDNSRRITIT